MDVVSEGEYRRARAAGVPGERIVFSGVGKTRGEMRLALEGGIRQFNVEMRARARGAQRGGERAGRGRADRDPGQPGRRRADPRQDRDRQGGEQVRRADRPGARGLCRGGARCRASRSSAIDVHIGSQLTELAPYEAAFAQGGGADRGAARATGTRSGGSTSAAASASPTGASNEAPPLALRLRRGDPAHGRASRLRDRDRAGAADRRQRRACCSRGSSTASAARGGTS